MTLVINCLTHDYLFQISDRRFVRLPDYKIVEDDANKNIFYCGHVAFSYTGLAEIEGKRGDTWLLDNLPESFETWINVVKEKATEAFKKIKLPSQYKRHAFVAIGWLRDKREGPLIPAVVSISNFQGPKGEDLGTAVDEFTVFSFGLPKNIPFLIYSKGQPIPEAELKQLYRNIKTCIERKTGSKTILRNLVITMRNVAKNNKAVGKNLLALGMPKVAAGKPGMVYPFVEDKMNTFMYFPSDSLKGVAYGPSIKCVGFTMSGLEMR